MINAYPINVWRSHNSGFDVEGRPTAGSVSVSSTVYGHLFSRSVSVTEDGRILTAERLTALLPFGVDVTTSDELEAVDAPGVRYRIESITPRRGPLGTIHHLSLELSRSN